MIISYWIENYPSGENGEVYHGLVFFSLLQSTLVIFWEYHAIVMSSNYWLSTDAKHISLFLVYFYIFNSTFHRQATGWNVLSFAYVLSRTWTAQFWRNTIFLSVSTAQQMLDTPLNQSCVVTLGQFGCGGCEQVGPVSPSTPLLISWPLIIRWDTAKYKQTCNLD